MPMTITNDYVNSHNDYQKNEKIIYKLSIQIKQK